MDPQSRLRILEQAHDDLGHKGVQAVWDMLKKRFSWPHMHSDIQHHIASCHRCQVRSTKKLLIPVTVSTPVALFQKVYIDVMKMPQSGNYTMIVAARDDLSGTCEAKALVNQTAENLAEFFKVHIYCRYGCPRAVITDNGSEVKAAFDILLAELNIPHPRISAYNKQAQGQVERGHFTLREAMVTACNGRIKQWLKKLALALFADKITVSRVTGFSPYQLLHGTDPILPFDLAEATFSVDGFYDGMTTAELLAQRIRQLERRPKDIQQAAETLKKSRFASKEQFEKRFRKRLQKRDYKHGELVLVRKVSLESSVASSAKTDDRYFGPYVVERKNRGGAYVLKEPDGSISRQETVAAFRLLPYITRDHWFMHTGWMGDDPESQESEEDSLSEGSDR
jgi:hypothetical protein